MKRLFILTLSLGLTLNAAAQHQDHSTKPKSATPPHAGHGPGSPAPAKTDPHAGHKMTMPQPAKPAATTNTAPVKADPHAGHKMTMPQPSKPAATTNAAPVKVDPHAGHGLTMPQPAKPTATTNAAPVKADPHAGHGVTMPQPAKPTATTNAAPVKADPHAGHGATSAAENPHTGHAMPDMIQPDLSPQPTIDPSAAEYYPYDMKSMGAGRFGMLLVDQLEYRLHEGADLLRWDSEGWYGSDFNRFWFRTEGEQTLQGPSSGFAEIHGYYDRLIAPFWDAQVGMRYDQLWEPGGDSSRFFGAIGLQGFAPYRFEVTPTLFISEDGDVSARLTATQDYRLTQRLVAQPRFETQVAAQDVPGFGVGDGFNYIELGLRLRYEYRREFAPYIGVNWERKLGESASLARRAGEDPDVFSFVAGLRIWF